MRRRTLGSRDPDELTLLEQMVLGLNQFRHLNKDVQVTMNDNWNAQNGTVGAEDGVVTTSRSNFDKQLKNCFFPQKSSGGKLAIYANRPNGITKSLLISKNLQIRSMSQFAL
jgi:hypothetical protein